MKIVTLTLCILLCSCSNRDDLKIYTLSDYHAALAEEQYDSIVNTFAFTRGDPYHLIGDCLTQNKTVIHHIQDVSVNDELKLKNLHHRLAQLVHGPSVRIYRYREKVLWQLEWYLIPEEDKIAHFIADKYLNNSFGPVPPLSNTADISKSIKFELLFYYGLYPNLYDE